MDLAHYTGEGCSNAERAFIIPTNVQKRSTIGKAPLSMIWGHTWHSGQCWNAKGRKVSLFKTAWGEGDKAADSDVQSELFRGKNYCFQAAQATAQEWFNHCHLIVALQDSWGPLGTLPLDFAHSAFLFSLSEIQIFCIAASNLDPNMILLWYEGTLNKGWNHNVGDTGVSIPISFQTGFYVTVWDPGKLHKRIVN